MRLAAGLRPDPQGSYSAPPDPLAVIKGREGKGTERVGIGRDGNGVRERSRKGRAGRIEGE